MRRKLEENYPKNYCMSCGRDFQRHGKYYVCLSCSDGWEDILEFLYITENSDGILNDLPALKEEVAKHVACLPLGKTSGKYIPSIKMGICEENRKYLRAPSEPSGIAWRGCDDRAPWGIKE